MHTGNNASLRVVIPCYNYGRFVRNAVASVLNQDEPNLRTEVVVVDDGSDDGESQDACRSCANLGAIVVHQSNAGLPAARNAGVRAGPAGGCNTDYLAFLDADDALKPNFARLLIDTIKQAHNQAKDTDQPISHAYGYEELVNNIPGAHDAGTSLIWRCPDWDPLLLLVTNLHPVTALIDRKAFQHAGGFDESMRIGYEDWELWIRFSKLGYRGVRATQPVFEWRRHSEETMIHRAVARHNELYTQIIERHQDLYQKRWQDILLRANHLLRTGEANWLDETLEPVVHRNRLARLHELAAIEQHLTAQLASARAEIQACRAETQRVRDEYESKPAVRLSRKLHRFAESLGPLGRPFLGAASIVKKIAAPGNRK